MCVWLLLPLIEGADMWLAQEHESERQCVCVLEEAVAKGRGNKKKKNHPNNNDIVISLSGCCRF